jgi:arginyl-tRNA synthetase
MLLEHLKNQIYLNLKEAAEKAREEGKLQFDCLPPYNLEKPREKGHGDLATNIAMALARPARMAPRQIAEALLNYFPAEKLMVSRCEVAGPGFINFFLEPSWVDGVIPEVEKMDERYGSSSTGKGEKVQVEFVSANPTGMLHMGNARGAALGILWLQCSRLLVLR